MGIDPALVREIVQPVLAVARPQRIILFGSAATGQMTPDSDVDLLVLEPVDEIAASLCCSQGHAREIALLLRGA